MGRATGARDPRRLRPRWARRPARRGSFPPGDVNRSWTNPPRRPRRQRLERRWPKLAEVAAVQRVRADACGLHAARRRRAAPRPPSWTSPPRRPRRRSCSITGAARAAARRTSGPRGGQRVRRGDAFIARVWEEATEAVLNERTRTNATQTNGTEPSAGKTNARTRRRRRDAPRRRRRRRVAAGRAPPPPSYSFPEGFEGVDSDAFNVTRAAISVCALLRHDARAKAHLTSVVVSGGVYPFARGFIAAQCALITADASCEGRGDARDEL